jgi:hypothetical protein
MIFQPPSKPTPNPVPKCVPAPMPTPFHPLFQQIPHTPLGVEAPLKGLSTSTKANAEGVVPAALRTLAAPRRQHPPTGAKGA